MVGPYQRFAHARNYICDRLQAAGFRPAHIEEIIVRHEQGIPVPGHLLLAPKGR
jgi:predicted TPR repeat methyltransferase